MTTRINASALTESGVRESEAVIVSDEARIIFSWITYGFVLAMISIFGIVTNIINIICFVRQGLKDSVNISLLVLAFSDLGCLITALGASICFNPAFEDANLPFDSIEIIYLLLGVPRSAFSGASSWFTALITLERCLCISMPLTVKSILTPRRVTVVVTILFIILIARVSPVYFASQVGMRFSPETNRTILGLIPTKDRETVDTVSFAINNVFIPFSAFLVITICTIILVTQLQQKTKWRQKATASLSTNSVSERDQKVAKMVVMISILFIACFTPLVVTFVAMIAVPGMSVDGPYRNVLYILGTITAILESTNSSSNIFIYYHMSSRYKAVFRMVLCLDKSNASISMLVKSHQKL